MKAIQLNKYGAPEDLTINEIEKPVPKPNEVLVKIKCSAINDYDWSMVRGEPKLYRLLFGLLKPKHKIPGMEFSGIVEESGDECQQFKPGDEVYGDISEFGFGTFAEYACFPEKAMLPKPKGMSFEDAASIPHAAGLAIQGLIEKGQISQSEKILINGAGGGVGTIALQLAKTYGAHVTGVDTGSKLSMMKELGFDEVLDYKETDFTKSIDSFDIILDAKTNRPPGHYLRSLKSEGRYITVGGTSGKLIRLLLRKSFAKDGKRLEIVALRPNQGLDRIHKMYEEGLFKTIIDGPYSLSDYPSRLRYFGEGLHTGKVIITI